jgi:dTDP-4-amino-4,6-dideoxygalactose transaminase
MGELIPFNVPYVPEASKKYVLEALESNHQQGDGPFTAKASKIVSDLVGGGHVLLTPSCTHALEMASMLANIGPGDEVILPSYTFTSAATAVTKFGATPVFVDIEMKTKGIDVNQVREAITSKTKAISWVNYAGVAPDIEGLQTLAQEFGLILIEDNAHGLGGSYQGKPLGSFGDFATQSFHATKNVQCGEGGALVVNNPKYIERAEIIREKGTNRSKFVRGEVQKYQWVDKGSSYLIAESLSAVLLGQLESFHEIQVSRSSTCAAYQSKLGGYTEEFFASTRNSIAHMFFLEFADAESRNNALASINSEGLITTSHYQALHNSSFGAKLGKQLGKFDKTLKFSNQILRLPLWYGMPEKAISKVISVTAKYSVQLSSKAGTPC